MNKEQVFELMNFIRNVYSNFDFDQQKLNAWHLLLNDQNHEEVLENAQHYAKENRYPPSPADLRTKGSIEKQQDSRKKEFEFARWIENGGKAEDFDWAKDVNCYG